MLNEGRKGHKGHNMSLEEEMIFIDVYGYHGNHQPKPY